LFFFYIIRFSIISCLFLYDVWTVDRALIGLQILIFNAAGFQIRPNCSPNWTLYALIGLQILIFNAAGLQIRPNCSPSWTLYALIGLQILIFNAAGLQIRPNCIVNPPDL